MFSIILTLELLSNARKQNRIKEIELLGDYNYWGGLVDLRKYIFDKNL
jgi:hypothetical protein